MTTNGSTLRLWSQGIGSSLGESVLIPSVNRHNNLISFLAVTQFTEVEIIDVDWDEDLHPIGHGADAEVRQIFIAAQRGYALKRHRALESIQPELLRYERKHEDLEGYMAFEERIFNGLVAELIILSHPLIRHHQSIIHLEGVTWEIPTHGTEVWPVLVLEKAGLGDLWTFAPTSEGCQLSLKDRLGICLDIASAITTLHENGKFTARIIHGDIKPLNVLMFKELNQWTQGELVYAKLADFGYAAWNMNPAEEVLFRLPRSKPWEPPEYHHREFTIGQAKRCDVYSFGLVCLWFLFHDNFSNVVPTLWEKAADMKLTIHLSEMNSTTYLEVIETLKHKGLLSTLARELVTLDNSLDSAQKENLGMFLASALAHDPRDRKIDLNRLSAVAGLQCLNNPTGQNIVQENIDYSCLEFNIAEFYVSMMYGSRQVPPYLAVCLQHEALHSPVDKIKQNAAFQYAICCRLGFGRLPDENDTRYWLQESGKSNEELMTEISLIRHYMIYRNPVRDAYTTDIMGSGWLTIHQEHKTKYATKAILQTEISGIIEHFGSDHTQVLQLRLRLVDRFIAEGKLGDAESHLLEILDDSLNNQSWGRKFRNQAHKKADPPRPRERFRQVVGTLELPRPTPQSYSADLRRVLRLTARLLEPFICSSFSKLYIAQKRWRRAEVLMIHGINLALLSTAEHNVILLSKYETLGRFYYDRHRYLDAERVIRFVLKACEFTLGNHHPRTLGLQHNLAATLIKLGKPLAVETLLLRLSSAHIQLYGSTVKIANLYKWLGLTIDSEHTLLAKIEAYKDLDTQHFLHTEDLKAALVWRCHRGGRFLDAEKLQLELLESLDKSVGANHPNRLLNEYVLARIYFSQKSYEKVESLITDKTDTFKRVFKSETRAAVDVLSLLTKVRIHQRRWEEADKASLEHLRLSKSRDAPLGERINANSVRALMLVKKRCWREAVPYVLGSVDWPSEHWNQKLCEFDISEVNERPFQTVSDYLKEVGCILLALILYLGFYSGMYHFCCVVVRFKDAAITKYQIQRHLKKFVG